MINWEEISNLHVITKLKQILIKWFGVELFYANQHSKIQGKILDRNYKFQNYFLKAQMQTNYGHEYLINDIEQVTDQFSEINSSYHLY
ncbi:MAG: hypothetical protein HQK53_20085, partial [Oligoflexia bacterium]|nr:hypothetical protein [Oligoflexia bacterium]